MIILAKSFPPTRGGDSTPSAIGSLGVVGGTANVAAMAGLFAALFVFVLCAVLLLLALVRRRRSSPCHRCTSASSSDKHVYESSATSSSSSHGGACVALPPTPLLLTNEQQRQQQRYAAVLVPNSVHGTYDRAPSGGLVPKRQPASLTYDAPPSLKSDRSRLALLACNLPNSYSMDSYNT